MKYVENVDYYIENKKWIWTEQFLLKRGFCCDCNCRHCPFKENITHLNREKLNEGKNENIDFIINLH